MEALRRSKQVRTRLVFVTGSPGVGKTAVTEAVRKRVTAEGGRYLWSKFDQLQTAVPYLGFLTCIDDFVRQVSAAGEAEVKAWRARLQRALGDNAGVVTQLIGSPHFRKSFLRSAVSPDARPGGGVDLLRERTQLEMG